MTTYILDREEFNLLSLLVRAGHKPRTGYTRGEIANIYEKVSEASEFLGPLLPEDISERVQACLSLDGNDVNWYIDSLWKNRMLDSVGEYFIPTEKARKIVEAFHGNSNDTIKVCFGQEGKYVQELDLDLTKE